MKFEFQELDAAIRSGRVAETAAKLKVLAGAKRRREEAVAFANLCRRSSLPQLGIAALRPFVRPPVGRPVRATAPEKIEYAACLQWLGLLREADELLQDVEQPGALLIRSFVALRRWNYSAAEELLRAYLTASTISDYERDIGRANLLAVLVHLGKNKESETLLRELKVDFTGPGRENLFFSVLKQELELAVTQGDLKRTKQARLAIENSGLSGDAYSRLYVQKWLAIAALRQGQGVQALEEVRAAARCLNQGETLRDADAEEAVALEDEKLAAKVFFGTPHAPLRNDFCRRGRFSFLKRQAFSFSAQPTVAEEGVELEGDRVPDRLLKILVSDFYVAPTVPQIFSALFPGRKFHEVHSPNLVHQAMHRLRQQEAAWLQVVEEQGRYRVQAKLPLWIMNPDREDSWASRLKAQLGADAFSAREFAKVTGISLRSAQRELKSHEPHLSTTRTGRTIRYRIR